MNLSRFPPRPQADEDCDGFSFSSERMMGGSGSGCDLAVSGEKNGGGPRNIIAGWWFGNFLELMWRYIAENINYNWLVVWLPSIFHFPINIGFMSSSQLTNSYFFRGVAQPPTSHRFWSDLPFFDIPKSSYVHGIFRCKQSLRNQMFGDCSKHFPDLSWINM